MHWVCDFETVVPETEYYKIFHDTRVILWCSEDKNFKREYNIDIYSWWDWVLSFETSQNIYFHNLNFDGDFILKSLKRFKYFGKDKWLIDKRKIEIKFFYSNNQLYYISIVFRSHKKDWITITILDSYKLLINSVEKLGEAVKIDKLLSHEEEDELFYCREPYKTIKEVEEDYLNYCFRDVHIVNLMLQKLFSTIKKLPTTNQSYLTISKLSNNLKSGYILKYNFNNNSRFDSEKLWKWISYDDWNYGHKFLKGGYTNLSTDAYNSHFKNINGVAYDFHSSYPTRMRNCYLPISLLLPSDLYLFDVDDWKWLSYVEVKINKAYLKNPKWPWLFLHDWEKKGRRYVRTLGPCTMFYTKEEWDFLNKYYEFDIVDIKEHRRIGIKIFAEYVDELYKLKESVQDEAERNIYKTILNSGYGDFAQKPVFDFYYESDKPLKIDSIVEFDDRKYQVYRETNSFTNRPAYILKSLNEKPEYCKNIWIAVEITSQARLNLWHLIEQDPYNIKYCDTDSVFLINKNSKFDDYIGNKIGMLGVEVEYDEAFFIAPKKYATYTKGKWNKLAFAGVSKKWLKKQVFEVEEMITNEYFIGKSFERKNTPSGLVLEWKDKVFKIG